MMDRLSRLRRGAIILASTFALWAPLVVLTGGFGFRIGPLAVSSRRPRNAIVLALLLAGLAWLLAPAGRRSATVRNDLQWLRNLARAGTLDAWRAWARLETTLIARVPAGAAARSCSGQGGICASINP